MPQGVFGLSATAAGICVAALFDAWSTPEVAQHYLAYNARSRSEERSKRLGGITL